MRTLIKEIVGKENESIELMGWVANRRDHGKLIFIDLRDRSGTAQAVFLPSSSDYEAAKELRSEWVIRIVGKVNRRPKGMENKEMEDIGNFEIQAEKLEILNQSEVLSMPIDTDGYEIGENGRMKYRYLDLRRSRLQKNLRIRSRVNKFVRDFLVENEFVEIETPILGKSTPEGARDYLVPSRLHPGNFYALPQSPQQYKQLLMVAGFEKYFQIARCFRDEDTRGDRQPEFTQLDLEMSFVNREEVMALNENLVIELVKNIFPEKKIQEIPFPRITYKEAMEKYGTDRPDLRKDKNDNNLLAFAWVVDFPFFEKSENGSWTFSHNPFSAPKEEFLADFKNEKNIGNILSTQYDIVLNGFEIGGGSIRNHQKELLHAAFNILKINAMDFSHMFDALESGAPPHGGIAFGLDRLLAILLNEPNIREVIAFPKTGDGRDLMMDAPSEVSFDQLNELYIEIKKSRKND